VAGLSLVGIVVCDIQAGLLWSPVLPTHVVALVAVTVFLMVVCHSRERSRWEARRLRVVSKKAQQVVLPPLPRRIADLRVACVYRAAETMAEVGGDLYAAAKTPYGTRLVIGDVKGKGLGALDDAAALLGAFREAAHQQPTLPRLAAALECSMRRHLAEASETDRNATERFVTALLVEFPAEGGVMRAVSCGHPLPIRLRDGRISALAGHLPAPPLGLASRTPDAYRQDTFRRQPGDVFLLYTDGLVEARDASGAFYSLTDREVLWRTDEGGPEALLQQVQDDLLRHTEGRLDDDVALVAVQWSPAS
jgi:serine phosphatase RsbU (regulator of sigma subunit)